MRLCRAWVWGAGIAVMLVGCVRAVPEPEGAAVASEAPAVAESPQASAAGEPAEPAEPPAVPEGWVDVRVGAAVLSVPPGWRTLRDGDDGTYPFDCGERHLPTLRVMDAFSTTRCPFRSASPSPREPAVEAVTVEELHADLFGRLVGEGDAVQVGALHGYARSLSGDDDGVPGMQVLLPDVGLYLHADPGDGDPAVTAAVLASVRRAPAVDAGEFRPFVGVDGQRLWWLEGAERWLVWQAPAGQEVGAWQVAWGATRDSWTVAVLAVVEPPDRMRPNLRPQHLLVVRVEQHEPVLVWSTTVRPSFAQVVDGLVVGGGPVWSPDGRYLAYSDVAERCSVVRVAGWLGSVPDGAPDVTAAVTDLEMTGHVRPFLRTVSAWEGATPGESYLVVTPDAAGQDAGARLPVVVSADGRVEFPQRTLDPPG